MTNLAVVIPVLNEEGVIRSCIEAVGRPPGVSVVVSDGGSTDATLDIVARDFPFVNVVVGPCGRGVQLDRGARAVSADAYLFVHADCRLPAGWHSAVCAALADEGVALGCFRLHTEPPPGEAPAHLLEGGGV